MASTRVRIPRLRHLRHRDLDGRLRGSGAAASTTAAPGTRRLKRLVAWLNARVTGIGATGAGQAFTADFANNEIDIAAHGRATGDGPFTVSSTTTLPAGLTAGTQYFLRSLTAGTLSFHRTAADANNDANPVATTDAGTGTHTMIPDGSDAGFVDLARQGIATDRINDETDIDNLI